MSGLGEIPDFILGQPLLEATGGAQRLADMYQQFVAAGILHSFRQGAAENRLCTSEGLLRPLGFGRDELVVCKPLSGHSMFEFVCLPSYSESLSPFLPQRVL